MNRKRFSVQKADWAIRGEIIELRDDDGSKTCIYANHVVRFSKCGKLKGFEILLDNGDLYGVEETDFDLFLVNGLVYNVRDIARCM